MRPLIDNHCGFYVTEKTPFVKGDLYLMIQTDLKDKLMPLKMLVNGAHAVGIWVKERPDIVVTTGTMVAYPFYLLSILLRKKFVFIETFGRANEPTVAGKMMQKHADLFFVQWESQKRFYDNAIYVGCLY